MASDGGDNHGFSAWLLKWGNSPSVAIFWAIIGCICSFFCPFFLGSEKWQAVGNLSPVRLMMMLLSCIATAGVYRVGFGLRHHKSMREEPTMFGLIMGKVISTFIFIGFGATFIEWGTWPNVVGLELLAVAVFGLLEMARPVSDFFLLCFFLCLPIIAGGRRHGLDFVYLGWPMLTVPLAIFFLLWREFYLRIPARFQLERNPELATIGSEMLGLLEGIGKKMG